VKISKDQIRNLGREKALRLREAAQRELRRASTAARKDHWRRFLRLVDDRLRELGAVELSDSHEAEPFEHRLAAARQAIGQEPPESAGSVSYAASQIRLAMEGSIPNPTHDSRVGAMRQALEGGSGDGGLERRLARAKEALYGGAG
jgi:hypothetical protein